MPKAKPMSAELAAMLSRPRQEPLRQTTRPMHRLERSADKWLARSGFFQKPDDMDNEVVDPNHITVSGGLRPVCGTIR